MSSNPHKTRDRWSDALAEAHLPDDLDRLAMVLALKARNDGTHAVASNPWLAQRIGVSVSTVQRMLKRLKDLGWIELTQRGGRRLQKGDDRSSGGRPAANEYALTIPTGQASVSGDLLEPTQQVTESSQQVTDTDPTGHGPSWADHPPRTDTPRKDSPPSVATNPNPQVVGETGAPGLGGDTFEDLWNAWPNHANDRSARTAWNQIPASERAAVVAAAVRFAAACRDRDPRRIPYASTWLRDWREQLPAPDPLRATSGTRDRQPHRSAQ